MAWQLSFENAEVRRCGRCGHCGHHRHCSRISRGKLGVPSHWAHLAHCSGLHRTQLTRQPIELQCEKSSTVSTICPLSPRALHGRWLKSFCSSLIREGRATQPHGQRPKIFSCHLRRRAPCQGSKSYYLALPTARCPLSLCALGHPSFQGLSPLAYEIPAWRQSRLSKCPLGPQAVINRISNSAFFATNRLCQLISPILINKIK